jgi:hypothetical protein
LDVAAWAALVSADPVEQLGAAADISALPDNQRRRLPAYARDMIRCTLPLLNDAPGAPVILAARHGDMISTAKLLTDLANREILSPSLFAMSVHNAAAGAMSLSLAQPGDQTALAAGAATLSSALTEAYARLAEAECETIVVAYAAQALPAIYEGHDEAAPGVFLSLLLRRAGEAPAEDVEIEAGRTGALSVVHALQAGVRRLRFPVFDNAAMAA